VVCKAPLEKKGGEDLKQSFDVYARFYRQLSACFALPRDTYALFCQNMSNKIVLNAL